MLKPLLLTLLLLVLQGTSRGAEVSYEQGPLTYTCTPNGAKEQCKNMVLGGDYEDCQDEGKCTDETHFEDCKANQGLGECPVGYPVGKSTYCDNWTWGGIAPKKYKVDVSILKSSVEFPQIGSKIIHSKYFPILTL